MKKVVLNSEPGSSTAKQRQILHQIKRRHGWSDDDLHDAIGAASTTVLSAAQASACIGRLGGMKLANPPGQKPSPYPYHSRASGAVRMVHADHIEQIERLLAEYFGDEAAGRAWLEKDFKVKHPKDLLTAKVAGNVIRVLKGMINRRKAGGGASEAPDGAESGSDQAALTAGST